MQQFAVGFLSAAVDDLASIRDYITARNSREIADQFADRLVQYCEGLVQAPHRGTLRNEIRPGLRLIGWRRTITIAFAVDDAARRVDIAGVFYREREVTTAMAQRP